MSVQVLPKIETDVISEQYGRFVIGPLERGFGITIGNALRRVLLSSLTGAAVTKIRISDVPHEFTTIPGVREDVMRFILNVKQLRLRMDGEEPAHMSLHTEGEGTVTAGDIVAPPEVEILNPDLYLMTVDDEDASIDIDFTVEEGRGYRPAEEGEEDVIGEMPVDAVFSPIRRVAFDVDQARVGQITDYDRLTLEIWSDNRVAPFDALKEAARILLRHLRLIAGLTLEEEIEPAEEGEGEEGFPSEVYDMPMDQLGLSTRVFNALRRAGVKNVGEVMEMLEEGGEDALLAVRNVGSKSLDEIREALDKAGLLEEIGGL
ncbi:MAG: DNA-directed RNA polymerase subunit alpha [Chloroflexota bacterium]|nr:DNA-directed RNA polymerase subunit alpha [Chloroflexota bacterium]